MNQRNVWIGRPYLPKEARIVVSPSPIEVDEVWIAEPQYDELYDMEDSD